MRDIIALAGVLLIAGGTGLIYMPAGIIVAGVMLLAGLFAHSAATQGGER